MLAAAKKALDRRSFLRAAPVAAVSAPVALRQVAADAGAGQMIPSIGMDGPGPGLSKEGFVSPYDHAKNEVSRLLRSGTIPDWKVKQLRLAARQRARWLDADLTTMRSISESTRYRIQEDREVKRLIEEAIDYEDSQSIWNAMIARFTPFKEVGP